MKKILSLSLALLMLVCLCLSMVSCEQDTAFSKYYSYLEGLEGKKDTVQADGVMTVTAKAMTVGEDKEKNIAFQVYVAAQDATVSVTLFLIENASTYAFTYTAVSSTTGQTYLEATGKIAALSYTGNESVKFDTYKDYSYNTNFYEDDNRGTASNMLKTLVLSMKPMMAKANVDVKDFYFISVDFPATEADAEAEEDLGGAFSPARWLYVGQMLVVGLGMVFLVLAILWIVLLIFEKAMGTGEKPAKPAPVKVEKSASAPAPEKKQAPAAPVAPAAPATDDGALVAAITAAIAATIASDEGLSRQFASGFRVVSFRKKGGKGAWNQ